VFQIKSLHLKLNRQNGTNRDWDLPITATQSRLMMLKIDAINQSIILAFIQSIGL